MIQAPCLAASCRQTAGCDPKPHSPLHAALTWGVGSVGSTADAALEALASSQHIPRCQPIDEVRREGVVVLTGRVSGLDGGVVALGNSVPGW